MEKRILMQICEGEYDRVEKNLNKKIEKLNEDTNKKIEKLNKIKLVSKVIQFSKNFSQHLAGDEWSDDLSEHYGKKLKFSFGYQTNRYPQSSSIFYMIEGKRNYFSIEDGTEFLELLKLTDSYKFHVDTEMVIDHAFVPRLIAIILGEKLMEKYMECAEELGYIV